MTTRRVLGFYKFMEVTAPERLRDELLEIGTKLDIKGTILLAHEGVNATVVGTEAHLRQFQAALTQQFGDLPFKWSDLDPDNPGFYRYKVKVKPEIVSFGVADLDLAATGDHVTVERWHELLDDPEVVVIDTRNTYEIDIGTFPNAVNPNTTNFREFPEWVAAHLDPNTNKEVAMFCTGGIRCEKASAYFKHKGFKNVYQLEGGIIEYTRQVKEKSLENKFLGQNFVFDDRRAERITDDVIANCHQCGEPFDMHTNCANDACHLLFIQCDACKEEMNNCCSTTCKEIHALPYEEQKALRKGQGNSNDIFKKGRADYLPYKKDLRNIFETLRADNQ